MSQADQTPDPDQTSFDDRIARTLIGLARISRSHRVLVAGSLSRDVMIELSRRGCARVMTMTHCGAPHGQYDAAVVAWQRQSLKALDVTLNWLVHFLRPKGVLAVWVPRDENATDQRLRSMLDRLGFRVEAGSSCANGLAVAARRSESIPLAKAA
jgi:hypothetical protein